MKIIESILKQFIDVPKNIDILTNQKIIEVESFDKVNSATNLVIGKVLTCENHPNSDHLHVTTVDLGGHVEQIVCGASNVAKDQYVIVAQVGTVLPGDFLIKASKIRGVESNGMICSLKELGLDESLIPDNFKDGIYYFSEPKEIGRDALEVLNLDGFVMELKLTPNRGDLLSHVGFAYDLSAMTGNEVRIPKIQITESDYLNPITVKIDTLGCKAYYARHFRHVVIQESPWWLKIALLAYGIKPINNVVDISNYVLITYGTPLHMFDAQKLNSQHILVRDAKHGEVVKTLDDIDRILNEEDIVITNGVEVVAIGGVMGLANTMIDENTTEVVLEAALFNPKHIQKTVKRLGLRSESSLRFERGVDVNRVKLGLDVATHMLTELASASVSMGVAEGRIIDEVMPKVEVDKNYFNDALGVHINEETLFDMFKRYRYTVDVKNKTYILQAPKDRMDLLIDADFLEEIARIYGLDNIQTKPLEKMLQGGLSTKQKRIRHLRHHLANLGLNEVITYSLLAEDEVYRYNQKGEKVSLILPLSEDRKTLRQSLVHGLLDTISFNQSRKQASLAIFELGHCFAKQKEDMHLGIALSGTWLETPWKKEVVNPDFYTLKGLLESVFSPLGINFEYQTSSKTLDFHPYRQADILFKGEIIGQIALVHPKRLNDLNIEKTYICEINLEHVINHETHIDYQMVSKYPTVTRDLAIVIDENIPAQELVNMIEQTLKKNVKSVEVFDVYQGEHIEKGKKSIAFSLVLGDQEKTLSTEDVDQMMKKVMGRLTFSYKAVVRS